MLSCVKETGKPDLPITPCTSSSSESRSTSRLRDIFDILSSAEVDSGEKTLSQERVTQLFQTFPKFKEIFQASIPDHIQREIKAVEDDSTPIEERLLRWLVFQADPSIDSSVRIKLDEALQTIPEGWIRDVMGKNDGQMKEIQEMIFSSFFSIFEDEQASGTEKLRKLLFLLENFPSEHLPIIFSGFCQNPQGCEQNGNVLRLALQLKTNAKVIELYESIQKGNMNERKSELIETIKKYFLETETFETEDRDDAIEEMDFFKLLEEPIALKDAADDIILALCECCRHDEKKRPELFKALALKQPEIFIDIAVEIGNSVIEQDKIAGSVMVEKIQAKIATLRSKGQLIAEMEGRLKDEILVEIVLNYICSDEVNWKFVYSGLENSL
ncbi:MAG: hypothetical protein K940chlam7_00001 [Chlamydiae bacterium]|nr:hypothetical protein [Chlamydiota bacterium]